MEEKILKAIEELKIEIEELRNEVKTEVKRWDDRFFQLSKDTLSFTRAVVTTAAIVAVLTPLLLKILDSPLFNRTIGKLLGD